MRAWPSPDSPALPGTGQPLNLYDTAAARVTPTAPGPVATIYVCGITPYDATHIGHAATYVGFDLLQRAWRDAGHEVRYVQNVTDVDDPLLERAVETGQDWQELADRETQGFREDMTALRVIAPDAYVGAVEAIPLIAEAVADLRAKGAAYCVDRDIYFSVGCDERFGSVAHYDRDTMLALSAERGGDPDRPGKKDPLDALLWQAERPDDPAWETPLGRGRPGWHIECAAIALHHLGPSIDVQGGGSDLAFPHHEIGASQAQVLTGTAPFARHYVHAGMVALDGEKMSKSRGNLVFVAALRREGHDPMAIRLALLDHHYRSDWEWAARDLDRAEGRLARWREAINRSSGPDAAEVLGGVRRHLADDLDAPGALAVVDRWAERARLGTGQDETAPRLVAATVDALLGITL